MALEKRALVRFEPPCGPIIGRRCKGVIRATGIPYARAERFERPLALDDRSETLSAVTPASACPQAPGTLMALFFGPEALPRDEACQRLSITLPGDLSRGERLPVMVFFHGGAYSSGAGDDPCYDPRALVVGQRLIVVSVTYRLGLFGYPVDARGPANLGLFDQIEALRWVQRNIGAFGGDQNRVTAFGHSAGGDAVAHLMATAEARCLFRRAIIQSAPLGIRHRREAMYRRMATARMPKAPGAGKGARAPDADEIVTLSQRAEARARPFGLRGLMPFGVRYGRAPLPEEGEIEGAWSKAAPDIEVLIGTTRREVALYLAQMPALSRLFKRVPGGRRARESLVRLLSERVYKNAALAFARRHADAGGRAWCYELEWGVPESDYACAHAVELALLFEGPARRRDSPLLSAASAAYIDTGARTLQKLWADFARGQLAGHLTVPGVIDCWQVAGQEIESRKIRGRSGAA